MSIAVSEICPCAHIAEHLAKAIGPRRYNMWFDRSVRLAYDGRRKRLGVSVPNQFVCDWIGKHFQDDLRSAAQVVVGQEVGIHLRVEPDQFTTDRPGGGLGADGGGVAREPAMSPPRRVTPSEPRSVPSALRHQFNDFVVGPSNELAFSAANRVVDEDNGAINPLFIHGGCGLGKTHLLQSLCRKMLQRKPDARVLYTTGEQFTNEFLTAMRSNKMDQFRKRVRRLDLLAVDDVHFIANKQATQQEFLHSFDAIELGGSRVVLASDSHPTLIKQFSEALVSRCVRGMVVQVKQPDADTRTRIINALALRRGLTLQDTVVEKLAGRCLGSIREIEGMLTKLHALASLSRHRRSGTAHRLALSSDGPRLVGNSLVDQLFHSESTFGRKRAISFDNILDTIIDQLKMDRAEILGNSRHRRIVLARSLLIHLAREMTLMSYPEIATAMGRRTHSTVITAAQRMTKQVVENATLLLPAIPEPISLVELIERLKYHISRA